MVTECGANFSVMAHIVENWQQSCASFLRSQSHERDRPIPESVVEIDSNGAKSGSAYRRRRVEASNVRLRFGLLSSDSVSIPRKFPHSLIDLFAVTPFKRRCAM
jgi:hypothetical protein